MAITICKGAQPITIINPHRCQPAQQAALTDLLISAVQSTYRHVPGFVSAAIHVSEDGRRVTNYAQYESAEAARGVRNHPNVPAIAAAVNELAAGFDFHLYEVTATVTAATSPVVVAATTELVTLVDVYHCEPAQQPALAELLERALEAAHRPEPGFISGSLHRSQDGGRVAVYAQWQSRAAVEAAQNSAALTALAPQIKALTTGFDGLHHYTVASAVAA